MCYSFRMKRLIITLFLAIRPDVNYFKISLVLTLCFYLFNFKSDTSHAFEKNVDYINYGSFVYYNNTPDTLYFFLDIEQGDSFQLRKALRNHQISKISLSSFGGSTFEGLQMAGIIYDKKLSTFVPKESVLGEGVCASSCALMFFAGKNRRIDGQLGVHQFYSTRKDKSDSSENSEGLTQYVVSEIIGFLNEFNTPRFVFEKMFQQPEMYYFSQKEKELLEKNPNKIDVSGTQDFAIMFREKMNVEVKKIAKQKQVPAKENACINNPKLCSKYDLCKIATNNNFVNKYIKSWSNSSLHIDEAKDRRIDCNVFEEDLVEKHIKNYFATLKKSPMIIKNYIAQYLSQYLYFQNKFIPQSDVVNRHYEYAYNWPYRVYMLEEIYGGCDLSNNSMPFTCKYFIPINWISRKYSKEKIPRFGRANVTVDLKVEKSKSFVNMENSFNLSIISQFNQPTPSPFVKKIQIELNRLGCLNGSADGKFGANSRRALTKFIEKSGEEFTPFYDNFIQELYGYSNGYCSP